MDVDDLSAEALAEILGDRPMRTYPALLSTEAEAQAWARAEAPSGAVVVADYQASPRGRGGLPWQVRPGEGLGFSLVLRPELASGAEGWLYVVATEALADLLGSDTAIAWPDRVVRGHADAAKVGMQSEVSHDGLVWGIVTVLIEGVSPPRGPLLGAAVGSIEQRLDEPPETVLSRYRERCATLDRHVRARLMPLGPNSPAVQGIARDVWADGALAIDTINGRRQPVRPQDLGALDDPA